MDGTVIASVTTYMSPVFHVDLCILLGWKALPQSVLGGPMDMGVGITTLAAAPCSRVQPG